MDKICKLLDITQNKYDLSNKEGNSKFIRDVTNSMEAIYNDNWYTLLNDDDKEMNQKNKLRTYRLFKKSNVLEPYLKFTNDPILRSSMTQLRISAHTLRIESERQKKTELCMRICRQCDMKETED